MGHGIAIVAAQAGYRVCLYDIADDLLQDAKQKIERFTEKSVEKGKITVEERQAMLGRIRYQTELEQVEADLAIEAAPENIGIKQELFEYFEEKYNGEVILATNTSSIPITKVAAGLKYPQKVVGMHFFNPAPIMKLVEVISGVETEPEVAQVISQLAEKMGKSPSIVSDTPGFIVNRVARYYYLESLKILEENVAGHEQIDALMESTGFRMGPFKLMDLIGVDTNHDVTQSIYSAFFNEPRFRPSRIQEKKVQAGHHGRKRGQGFYTYGEKKT